MVENFVMLSNEINSSQFYQSFYELAFETYKAKLDNFPVHDFPPRNIECGFRLGHFIHSDFASQVSQGPLSIVVYDAGYQLDVANIIRSISYWGKSSTPCQVLSYIGSPKLLRELNASYEFLGTSEGTYNTISVYTPSHNKGVVPEGNIIIKSSWDSSELQSPMGGRKSQYAIVFALPCSRSDKYVALEYLHRILSSGVSKLIITDSVLKSINSTYQLIPDSISKACILTACKIIRVDEKNQTVIGDAASINSFFVYNCIDILNSKHGYIDCLRYFR